MKYKQKIENKILLRKFQKQLKINKNEKLKEAKYAF